MNYIPFGKWTVRAVARSALPSRQRMHRDLKNRWIGLQAVMRRPVTQDYTRFARCTPRPRLVLFLTRYPCAKGFP